VSAPDTSGEREALPYCETCANTAIELHRAAHAQRSLRDALLEAERAHRAADTSRLVRALATVGGVTIILACACVAVLALRMAGGAS